MEVPVELVTVGLPLGAPVLVVVVVAPVPVDVPPVGGPPVGVVLPAGGPPVSLTVGAPSEFAPLPTVLVPPDGKPVLADGPPVVMAPNSVFPASEVSFPLQAITMIEESTRVCRFIRMFRSVRKSSRSDKSRPQLRFVEIAGDADASRLYARELLAPTADLTVQMAKMPQES